MSKIDFIENFKPAVFFGLTTGITATVGIWGARHVSCLPHLPMKGAAITGAATFASTYLTICFRDSNKKNGNQEFSNLERLTHCAIIIIGGAALAVSGNRTFVDRNITPLASIVTTVASQVTATGIILAVTD